MENGVIVRIVKYENTFYYVLISVGFTVANNDLFKFAVRFKLY